MSATLPYVWMDVSADVSAKGITAQRSSQVNGLGDVVLMPLMLNQNLSPDFNINYRVAFYAPTGSYEVGRLANPGKNFWTVEPTVGFMYFGQTNGIEAYSIDLTRRSVISVVGESTSKTTTGSTWSAAGSNWPQATFTSGYRTRPAGRTFTFSPKTSHGGSSRRSSPRSRRRATRSAAMVPPVMATGWVPSNS